MDTSNNSVFDSPIYSSLFTNKKMKAIWSDENLINSWLLFEVSIAKSQSTLSLIPKSAVTSIESAAKVSNIDWEKLSNDTKKVGMAIKPLIDQLTHIGDDNVKKYLHWGCTTQDLLDTCLAIRIKQTLDYIRIQLIELGDELKLMSIEHKNTVMVARTNSMDALSTTFGLHVSGYLQEIKRHIYRLDNLYEDAITGTYGGAVGNLSSLGEDGIKVRKSLFNALGLTEPKGIRNASLDSVVEVIQFFSLIHGTLVRIANDVETMGRASIGELRESGGNASSSTMPHKANPRSSNMIQTFSRMGWMYASGAPNMMDQRDTRSASMRVLNWSIVPEASLTVSASLSRAIDLIKNLIINKEKMLENFSASRNFVMSESVMMRVAEKAGRGNSYNKIKDIIADSKNNHTLFELLRNDEYITSILTEDEIKDACNPGNYLGCNDILINETIKEYEKVISS